MYIQKVGKRYRVREMYKRVTYEVWFDYKPSEREAREKLAISKIVARKKTLNQALTERCQNVDNCLSSSTIAGYLRIINYLNKAYPTLMATDIGRIDDITFQKFINDYAKDHKPKTVRNVESLIETTIKKFIKGTTFDLTLPRKVKVEKYIPTDTDIKELLHHVKDTEYEIPIKLGLNGLRLSEIMALDVNTDIGDGTIKIDKAKVKGPNGYVIKSTKTLSSSRTIKVSKELTDMIKAKGTIYDKDPSTIQSFLLKLHRTYNLPHFSMHALRHYWCSLMISEGVPFTWIKEKGGWSFSGSVMERVYAHNLKDRDYSKVNIDYISKLES